MIRLQCDDIVLSDGSTVKIGTTFNSIREIPKAIVRAVYVREIKSGKTSSQAEMNTCVLCGYETQNAIKKIVKE